ncbi:hypothetical protein H6G89_07400 [Oscillatoria sp. FACHB-1407]|uniref:hypothetical protein n=1 Tax=Oscillatoria sp. FACHB-1407 TaxID=2692847 RepID=UPI001682B081|nr:hypothetical protein [Oscillatoria sp. FACHB-1407]MBD2460867.1 hypothetical protein [Oscillatoria sp. FACHB-1407]
MLSSPATFAIISFAVQRSIVIGRWSMVNGQWLMVNGQWSMVNRYGQWSMVNGQSLRGQSLGGN